MARVFLMTLLVTILVQHRSLGARCRFTSWSGSVESCIFSCRCTDGCDITTGDCLNGGQCEDGHPSGYRWRGPACQTGNIAYRKTASQSTDSHWAKDYPAGVAVDGNTNANMGAGSCAHPEDKWNYNAWWMVDLGETYNLSRVIIYNRDSYAYKLDTFVLSVGDSSNRTRSTQCARHNGSVAAGATINETCMAVGRYLSFRREGGKQAHVTGLCEVVVIGHKHISCQHCPSRTACNDFIGCDACAPGKQQPDCGTGCDSGTYGVNCEENCGRCKNNQSCDIKNGYCTTGCKTWYATDICKAYIYSPRFEQSDMPSVQDITTSSVTVRWPKAKNITSGLEMHYYYVVWLQTGRETFINVSQVPQVPALQRLQFQITGLTSNTNYSVYIEPYRQQDAMHESGASTGIAVYKTNSIMIDPTIPSMMTSGGSGSGPGVAAGLSVSVIVVLAVVCLAILFVIRRRRAGKNTNEQSNTTMSFSTGLQDNGGENAGFETDQAAGDETDRAAGDGNCDEVTEQEKVAGPEYVNTQQVTRGVAVGDIAAYVTGKRRQDGFKSEFQILKSGIRANCTAAKKPQNKNKNRFQDIIAYDHTRVVLSVGKKECDYINANYITGCNKKKHAYIACQGPRDTTIEDMWRMVWQVKSNTIVMLANLTENGKEKCSQYWPEKNGRRTWGHFTTESVSEEKVADYVVRQFSLRNEDTSEMRRIRQLHFTSWPDRGTPQYAYPLLAFRRKVHSFDRAIRGPLVVHCSAGVGRTGTFMAIDILIQQAAAEGKVDVFQCINQLRTQRMNMVQTLEQYVFVYQAMIESSQTTVVPCSILRQTFDELCRNRQIEQQFERLSALKPLARKVKCAALEPNNVSKNRNVDIIPDDQHRPYLLTPWTGRTNYINAVFVHGYKQRNAFIVTQSPMASTVVDLWRMLADHESRTVIMLDDCDVTDDQCAIYWPTKEGTTQQFGPFHVQLVQTLVSATSNITVREFKLTKSARDKETATVLKQFHLTGVWSKGASLPSNKTVVLELLGLVENWQQMSGNGPVTVHCSDGASRCGLACAAGYVLEHLKVEQEVDVFHAVQHIRTTRPQLVTDREQYGFLYEIALEYMSQFDEYANFH